MKRQIDLNNCGIVRVRARTGIERHLGRRFKYTREAIPTKWNGVTYVSRLEAKHAYLATHECVPLMYEPTTFYLLTGERYTPDFRFGFDPMAYAEVKPNGGDFHKAESLNRTIGCRVLCLEGEPTITTAEVLWQFRGDDRPFNLKLAEKLVQECQAEFWDPA